MKVEFITITISGKCFDLPKDMAVPQQGDNVFIDGLTGEVDHTNYHIVNNEVTMISIFAKEQS